MCLSVPFEPFQELTVLFSLGMLLQNQQMKGYINNNEEFA
jgi:hypothetical protein